METGRFDAAARAVSRRGLVGGATLLLLGRETRTAAGEEVQAGSCGFPAGSFVTNVGKGGVLAQSFVAEASGSLSRITLTIVRGKRDKGNYDVQLYGTLGPPYNFPDINNLLTSTTIQGKSLKKGDVELIAEFTGAAAVPITSETAYAVAVAKTGKTGPKVRAWWNNAGTCANGTSFTREADSTYFSENIFYLGYTVSVENSVN